MTRKRTPEERVLPRYPVLVDRTPYPTLAAAFRACGISTHDAPYQLKKLQRMKELDHEGFVFTLIENGIDDL
jgi:hypothetical protein